MKTWFTGDMHFNHTNIIKYCNRPFRDYGEMNEEIIVNWNKRIQHDDHVYILGDFGMGSVESLCTIAMRLNGKKFLIAGNHDHHLTNVSFFTCFTWVKETYLLTIQDQSQPEGKALIWLSHYAHRVWPHKHHGAYHLYGHSHGTLPMGDDRSLDVGMDVWNFSPIDWSVIKHIMKSRKGSTHEEA